MQTATSKLEEAISKLQTSHLNGFFIVAGDFNHANMKLILPKLYQHVNFALRGENCLDKVYTNVHEFVMFKSSHVQDCQRSRFWRVSGMSVPIP